jgi:subtilisin family serine protease
VANPYAHHVQERLRQVNLGRLMRATVGDPTFRIALIDGVVAADHPRLRGAAIEQLPAPAGGAREAPSAHATFLASMLVGEGPDVLGLCRGCTLVSVPVVDPRSHASLGAARVAVGLARAIRECVRRGVELIQISMAFDPEVTAELGELVSALANAAAQGICTIIATGNDGALGASPVLRAPGVIPVAMAAPDGLPHPQAALGPTIGMRGLLAPGAEIPGAIPPDRLALAFGSSYAASFVTGTLALLRCARPDLPRDVVTRALLLRHRSLSQPRSLVPPRLDGEASFEQLSQLERSA